jgi:DNA-binding CsgD family transcriptional regulator
MEDIAEKSNLVSITSNLVSGADKDLLIALEGFITNYKRTKQIQNIPLKLFSSSKLGVLEVIVKYLKENTTLSYADIAKLLNRDQRTIWTTYSKAIKKHKEPFRIDSNDEFISISSFSDMNYSPLQVLIKELEAKGHSLKQIARLTNRSYKNIWMTKKRDK